MPVVPISTPSTVVMRVPKSNGYDPEFLFWARVSVLTSGPPWIIAPLREGIPRHPRSWVREIGTAGMCLPLEWRDLRRGAGLPVLSRHLPFKRLHEAGFHVGRNGVRLHPLI